jgi:hypothetical protein
MAKTPAPKKPWDIRDSSRQGDHTENEIFKSVGRALTEWENVENSCARLFAIFVSAHQQRAYHAPAVRAYGSIVGFTSRGTMLRLAAKAYFDRRKDKKSIFAEEFKTLIDECSEYAARRNEIAHGSVKSMFVTEKHTKNGSRLSALGFYLLPSFYNPKKYKDEQLTYQYISSDILHYSQEFTKLDMRLNALRENMLRKKPKA